jgi:hypothetical protein
VETKTALKAAFAPEMLAFYLAMLVPALLGYVLGSAWAGIVAAVAIVVGFLVIRRVRR